MDAIKRRDFVSMLAGVPLIGRFIPTRRHHEQMIVSLSFVEETFSIASSGAGYAGNVYVHRAVEVYESKVKAANGREAIHVTLEYYDNTPDQIVATEDESGTWHVTARRYLT